MRVRRIVSTSCTASPDEPRWTDELAVDIVERVVGCGEGGIEFE